MTQAGPAVASHRLQIVRTPYALTAVMFLIAAAWYAVGIERSGITSADVDPVSRIPAQDEAVYAREAIHMSSSGHWLTPVYMGRYALNKPPLLQWLAAGSVRAFGISAWAVRLPSLLAASATTVLVFWVVWRTHSLLPAVAAALLLASSHLFFVFARLAMTDMLLTLWITVSLVTVLRDPRLERTSSVLIFGAASGTAILTKAAAGVLPLIALMGLAVFGPRDQRPSFRRVLAAAALTAAIAIPWHVYQLIAHTRWFVAEYILTQHFAVGLAAPPQYSNENHLLFYARRLWLMDPVLCIAAAIAIPTIARGLRKRAALALWPAMLLLELFAFRYRSAYDLLPLLPMLAILAGEVIARVPLRGQVVCAAFLLACAVIKTAYGDEPWGVPAGVVS
ncbi:MAG: glycosyltransferase family 39 protein, partial [Acidobacteriia bacterium]|nr:glycosyltransferase family 39 protein [Terriglobia bacterium]